MRQTNCRRYTKCCRTDSEQMFKQQAVSTCENGHTHTCINTWTRSDWLLVIFAGSAKYLSRVAASVASHPLYVSRTPPLPSRLQHARTHSNVFIFFFFSKSIRCSRFNSKASAHNQMESCARWNEAREEWGGKTPKWQRVIHTLSRLNLFLPHNSRSRPAHTDLHSVLFVCVVVHCFPSLIVPMRTNAEPRQTEKKKRKKQSASACWREKWETFYI